MFQTEIDHTHRSPVGVVKKVLCWLPFEEWNGRLSDCNDSIESTRQNMRTCTRVREDHHHIASENMNGEYF